MRVVTARHTIRYAEAEGKWLFYVLSCSKNTEHILNCLKNIAHTYEMDVVNIEY